MTTTTAEHTTSDDEARLQPAPLGAVAVAHSSVDIQTSALPVFLPSLLTALSLNYSLAAGIVSANSLIIAIAQPSFGLLGDRRPLRWLALVGVLVCGAAMALVPIMGLQLGSYWLVIAAVVVSGIGSAAFHPEALAAVRQISGARRSTGSSIFFFGGNVGFALGPLIAGYLISGGGLPAVSWLFVVSLIGAASLLLFKRAYVRPAPPPRSLSARAGLKAAAGLVVFLMVIIILRQTVASGLTTFIPLYFNAGGALDKTAVSQLISIFSFAGTLGTLFSGSVADRLGTRAVMVGAMVIVLGALLTFITIQVFWVQAVALAVAGAALTAPWTLSVVMVQDALPGQPGLAGGLTLGTAYTGISLGVYALGVLADHLGLNTTMWTIVLLPALVSVLSLFIRPQRVVH
jgi:FSR family fosmidomycin resistance protein-like MFS transporter